VLGCHPVIFASVGSMLPFDRFVKAVDEWAGENPDQRVFIQIGGGDYEPRHAEFARMVPLADYRQRLRECALFVAHVGMGSILQALEEGKQMLLLPRRIELGEHTTDHQIHTAHRFGDTKGLEIVDDEVQLKLGITRLIAQPLETGLNLSNKASPQLLEAVANYLSGRKAS
jgi:UDP-N-acetylglucosamine transferase subunit ALG13